MTGRLVLFLILILLLILFLILIFILILILPNSAQRIPCLRIVVHDSEPMRRDANLGIRRFP